MPLTHRNRITNRQNEDELLLRYWQKVVGTIFAEVIIGQNRLSQWPQGSSPRRIDSIRITPNSQISTSAGIITFTKINAHNFAKAITGADVEVIEWKPKPWRGVIGQAIIGQICLRWHIKTQRIGLQALTQ